MAIGGCTLNQSLGRFKRLGCSDADMLTNTTGDTYKNDSQITNTHIHPPPDSLAPHAEQLVVYVTTRILPAYISDPNPRPRGAGAAGGGGDEGPTVAEPGYEVAAKCGALAAAARALAPEHERDEASAGGGDLRDYLGATSVVN